MKKKLLIILGAGSSISCGLPSVAELDSLVHGWSADWARLHNFSNHYETLSRGIDTYYRAGEARPRPSLNFEKILGEMVALCHWMTPAPFGNALRQPACAGAAPPHVNFRSPGAFGPAVEVMDQLSYILKELARHVRARCAKLEASNKNMCQYAMLADKLSEAFDVGVYNLNYDTLALSAWHDAFTGFDPTGEFEAVSVHRRAEWNFVYHLHGSVHHSLNRPSGDRLMWRADINSSFHDSPDGHPSNKVSEGKTLPITSLVAGGFKLDQLLVEPFHSLHAALVRHAYEADAILIGGYGFADEHVNRALSNRLIGRAVAQRPPVMILDRAGERTDPMARRYDLWSHNLIRTLGANGDSFREPGHTASWPDSAYLLAHHRAFEVSHAHRVALWHGGFIEVASRIVAILSWLSGTNDSVLIRANVS